MKHHALILTILLLASSMIRSQTVEEADSLYLNYEFDKAVETYDKLSAKLIKARKQAEAEALKPAMEKAEKAARMLRHCEDIQIIDSIILDKAHFIDAYMISSDAGYLAEQAGQLYYINQFQNKRYFGLENRGGLHRLFSELKLQDNWTDRTELSLPYDTESDYNYPFVMPDGVTLYFASTEHGSLGGYDLFISRYSSANDAYFAPTQLGMPFNSPYNDYMLAIDEMNDIGYFATDRFQPEGKVVIYTYIPNQSVKPIDSDDVDYLVKRARIYDIRDSWQENREFYRNYIQHIKNDIAEEQKKGSYDFTFVINDNIIYHTLDDFDSTAARQTFRQLQDLDAKIMALEAELDKQRQEYSQSAQQAQSVMKNSILQNERQLLILHRDRDRMEMNVRNLEIREIRTKN